MKPRRLRSFDQPIGGKRKDASVTSMSASKAMSRSFLKVTEAAPASGPSTQVSSMATMSGFSRRSACSRSDGKLTSMLRTKGARGAKFSRQASRQSTPSNAAGPRCPSPFR